MKIIAVLATFLAITLAQTDNVEPQPVVVLKQTDNVGNQPDVASAKTNILDNQPVVASTLESVVTPAKTNTVNQPATTSTQVETIEKVSVVASAQSDTIDNKPVPLFTRVTTTPLPATFTLPPPQVPVLRGVFSNDQNAKILRYDNDIGPDGSYNYVFETDNGIYAEAQGIPRNLGGNPPIVPIVAQGGFGWTSPEGKSISIAYIADENGYRPSGDAIPTPPPIPAAIARAIAYITRSLKKK